MKSVVCHILLKEGSEDAVALATLARMTGVNITSTDPGQIQVEIDDKSRSIEETIAAINRLDDVDRVQSQ